MIWVLVEKSLKRLKLDHKPLSHPMLTTFRNFYNFAKSPDLVDEAKNFSATVKINHLNNLFLNRHADWENKPRLLLLNHIA